MWEILPKAEVFFFRKKCQRRVLNTRPISVSTEKRKGKKTVK